MKIGRTYTPILKWKQGEQFALLNLSEETRKKTIPFFCLVNKVNAKQFVKDVSRFWGESNPFYLGFHQNLFDATDVSKSNILEEIIAESNKVGLKVIPVICSLNSTSYLNTIKRLKNFLPNGILLHFKPSDFKNLKAVIDSSLKTIDFEGNDNIDILVDLFRINSSIDIEIYSKIIIDSYNTLNSYKFRKFIFGASSFPESLAGTKKNSISTIERVEWRIWKDLIKSEENINFADYAIDDPFDISLKNGATIVPTIRYTKDDYWYITRGEYNRARPYDYSQYHILSKLIISNMKLYCGKDYSWGDNCIYDCANRVCTRDKCNHGSPSQWVKYGTNHHITYVSNQI